MIGEKIKAARIEKGLTAKELAIKSEVTPGYISQIERELISPFSFCLDADCKSTGNPHSISVFSGRTRAGYCN